MEYSGSLHRPSSAEPGTPFSAGESSDSSVRLKMGTGPLFYTSAVPATRMQIITQPLSGVPAEANTKLSSRERFRLLVAAVISSLFVGLLSFMIVVGTWLPDVGLSTQADAQGRQVVTWLVPNGIAYQQGVRRGDVVLSSRQNGSVRSVMVAMGGDSSSTVEVTTEGAKPLSALQQWVFTLLALIFIGMGGSVYVKARQRVVASSFYLFCLASATSLVISPVTHVGYGWILALMFVSIIFFAGSFAFFFLNFPVRVGTTRLRHRAMVACVLMSGAVVLSAYFYIYNFDPLHYKLAQILGYGYLLSCVLMGLACMARALIKESSREVRQQMTIVLSGTGVAIGPTLLLGILPGAFGLPHVQVDLTALTIGIMPLSFAYAMTQGQMLGARNFIRRSVVYVLMGFGVLLVFSLIVGALGGIVPQDWQHDEVGLIGFSLAVFLIALSYGYVQNRVERLVDKYIYHDAYDYKEALLQFSAQLAAEQNLHTLAGELVQRTCNMMNLTCGVLLLATPPDKETTSRAETLYNQMDDSGDNTESLWSALRNSGHLSGILGGHISRPLNGVGGIGESPFVGSKPPDGNTPLRVVPYARYGDFADWLIEGLHYELSQLGIRLDEADAPMQLIYFNSLGVDGQYEDTSRLRTTQLGEESLGNDRHVATSTPRTGIYSTGQLKSYTGSLTSGPLNGRSLRPTSKLDIESIRSFLGVPLWTRSRFVGVLCLGGKRTGERFTKDDLSLLSTLGSQAALAIYNAQLYEAREQALLDTIGALAHAIEAKDGYTIQHCENMTGRAVALAQSMGLPSRDIENIRMGAILHDIGKIGIPDAVLNKPGKLTAEEYELMKQHAAIGARIVQSVGALQDVVPIVRYHQERYDGSGYPEGLRGETIPIGARIIGVVDTYGAMTEDRVYRPTPGHDKAIAELTRLAGRQFDPFVVDAFVRLIEDRPEIAEHPRVRVSSSC